MPPGTPDDVYLEWLHDQVFVRTQRGATYWKLLRQMHQTEFLWFVPNDENRAEDGKDLRREWIEQSGFTPPGSWMELGCSFLEMLVALARRMEFEADETPQHWFWHLLENLEFESYHDGSGYSRNYVTRRMRVVIDRRYDMMGNGGLFPLRNPSKDQRKVELWYQMSEYLLQDL
jgi:hypothetical protein